MDITELIKTRKSVRTFDGKVVSEEDREKLSDVITELKQLLMKMKYAESSYRAASRRTSEAVNELAMRG